MTPEEISKKAYEAYPKMSRVTEPHGVIPADNKSHLIGDANEDKREGYIEAYKEISTLPTIKGWVVRDEYGLSFYRNEPYRVIGVSTSHWTDKNGPNSEWILDNSLFPNLKWEDEPIEVELPIIVKKK